MLKVMDQSTHEDHLSQPLQTNNKQNKIAVTFLPDYTGSFVVNDKKNKYFSTTTIDADDFSLFIISLGASELESLDEEIIRIIIGEGCFSEINCPFLIKPIFLTLGSFIKKSPGLGIQFNFFLDDSLR